MARSKRTVNQEILNEYFEVPRSKMRAYLAFTFGGVGLVLGLSLIGMAGAPWWTAAALIILGALGLARGVMEYRNASPILIFRPHGLEASAWSKDMPPLIPWKDIERCEAFLCPGNNACDYLAIDLSPDAKKKHVPSSRLRKKIESICDRYNVEHDIMLENTLFAIPISEVVRQAKMRIQAVSPHLPLDT